VSTADKITPEVQLKSSELGKLIQESEQTEATQRQFMEPAAVTKKKRGRPSNADKQAETEAQTQATPAVPSFDCAPAFKVIFGITGAWIVRYTGEPELGLLPEEVDALGAAWGAVAQRYLPDFMATHGELFVAVAVTGGVGMRIYTVASKLVEEKQRKQSEYNQKVRNENQPVKNSDAIVQ